MIRGWSWIAAAVLAGMLTGCGPCPDPDEYTIRLEAFYGPGHMQKAQHFKEGTEQQAGWKDMFIVSKSNVSELYWGKYPTIEAAKPDLERAKKWKTKFGVQVYPMAIVITTPGKEIGPPEWNLANAKGMYTVLIATFFDVPEMKYIGRRNFAVEYCKQLRGEGQEAYYCHGLAQSVVTIGMFDKNAIVDVTELAGTVTDNRATHQPFESLLDPARITQKRINDERINQILRKHPLLMENGRFVQVAAADIVTKVAKMIDKPSYVTRVPKDTNSASPMFNSRGELISEPATSQPEPRSPETQPR